MSTRFGFVSTFPPTQCGLATFTAALRGALLRSTTDEGWVVRLVDTPAPGSGDEVVAQLITGDSASLRRAAAQLNLCDVAIMQHEYGIYGGADGSEILHLLGQVRVPCVVVLHTVLTNPTPHQRQVLEAVIAQADAVVTMTMAARERLAAGYAADMTKVCIIAHGAPALQGTMAEPVFRTGQFTVLTWGLLGPGKGIEWGIEAMAMLQDLQPMPRYMVAGQTHPKVLLHEGDAYRDRLREQVRQAELGSLITFDGHYRTTSALASLVRSADVVLLPYDSTEQVTSGVLIEAVAAGKPVVATQFPHAKELLAGGAGLLVPHRDPAAIAAALRSVITRRDVMTRMTAAATAAAPQLLWPAIADQYRELAGAGHGERGRMTAGSMTPANDVHQPVFDHLERLTDDRGLFEHARHTVPRREHGYCVDDVARGLVVVCREPHPGPDLRRLARCYLAFVLDALDPTGACHNRMAVDGKWRDEAAVGDWWGRALWGLGVAATSAHTRGMRARALVGFRIAAQRRSRYARSMAFAALGAAEVLGKRPDDMAARGLLTDTVAVIGGPEVDDSRWPWPEERLSYGNAAVAEALIVAGEALPDGPALNRGLSLLEFLLRTETRDDHLSVTPVGGRGRDDAGPGYDQQPLEVSALADACASAFRITRQPSWLTGISLAWDWFLGNNDSATPMFDPQTGGGYDGLKRDGRNLNQGAESTLAMLATAQQARRIGELG